MNEILIQVVSYLFVWVLSIVFFNFLTAGFLIKWVRVKASRGRFVLIELDGVAETSWYLGKIEDSHLAWKQGKNKKSLLITREDVYYKHGVKCINIDSETNAIRKADWSVAEKVDSEAFDDLLQRAIESPELANKNEKILLAIALIIIIGGVAYVGYQVTGIKQLVLSLGQTAVGVIN